MGEKLKCRICYVFSVNPKIIAEDNNWRRYHGMRAVRRSVRTRKLEKRIAKAVTLL